MSTTANSLSVEDQDISIGIGSVSTRRSVVSFVVLGKPQSRGSKQAQVRYGRDGKPISKDGRVLTFAKDDNPKSSEWMNLVRDKAYEAMGGAEFLPGAIVLTARFYFTRPKGDYRTGKNAGQLKPTAPTEHLQKPDFSKCMRAVEDALSKLVYRDDCQVIRYGPGHGKFWTEGASRAEITVETVQ